MGEPCSAFPVKRTSSSGWMNSSFSSTNKLVPDDHIFQLPKPKKSKTSKTSIMNKADSSRTKKLLKENGDIPWIERFAPLTKNDLAVHKKKVSEVEDWLKENLKIQHKRKHQHGPLLLLTGPSGSGKTATIRALSKELDFEIKDWSSQPYESMPRFSSIEGLQQQNDVPRDISQSQTTAFNNFFLRANKYPSLFSNNTNRIVLIEEYPNVFLMDSSSFHNILRKFYRNAWCPAVFIVSDCTSGESLENKLFPKYVQAELSIRNICFNPVAPTMLVKALDRICSNLKDISNEISKQWLEEIANSSTGDLRNAINTLQFLSIKRSPSNANCSSSVLRKSRKRKNDLRNDTSSKVNNGSSQRDSSLFLFHALGKILYCKRDPEKMSDADQLPPSLHHFARLPLRVNPEEVFERTSISAAGFSLFLHENYLAFADDIDVIAEACSYFSDADIVSSEWAARDILNMYAPSISSRGLMFSLKPTSSGNQWRPIRKPQDFNSFKEVRNLCSEVKSTFKSSRLSLKELQTELIPYLPKLRTPLTNEQLHIVQRIGCMRLEKFNRYNNESLSMKDVADDDFNTQETVFTLNPDSSKNNTIIAIPHLSDPEEDYVIEE